MYRNLCIIFSLDKASEDGWILRGVFDTERFRNVFVVEGFLAAKL